MNEWKFAPFIPFITIGYCCIVLFVEVGLYWKNGAITDEPISYFKPNLFVFDAFGETFFAYMCQPNYYEVIRELEKRDCSHQKRVFLVEILIKIR